MAIDEAPIKPATGIFEPVDSTRTLKNINLPHIPDLCFFQAFCHLRQAACYHKNVSRKKYFVLHSQPTPPKDIDHSLEILIHQIGILTEWMTEFRLTMARISKEFRADLGEIKSAMTEIKSAMTELKAVSERQAATAERQAAAAER